MPFPNKDTQFKTGEKQVEVARKGGIASGEAKRKRKLFAELIEKEFEKEATLKINKDESIKLTKKEVAAMKLVKTIIDKETNDRDFLKALEFARDTIGEKPVEKVQNVDIDPDVMAEVERIVDENTKSN